MISDAEVLSEALEAVNRAMDAIQATLLLNAPTPVSALRQMQLRSIIDESARAALVAFENVIDQHYKRVAR